MLEGAYDNPNSDNTIVASFLTLLSTWILIALVLFSNFFSPQKVYYH
jgi:hypothetical protein